MNSLTNIIEAVIFASGEAVPVKYIVEKLGCSLKEVNAGVNELKEKYGGESGIHLLTFNGKLQFATNPQYKQPVSEVLTPIKEKEFTKTILECAAIIAYKQPITKPELEEIRQVSCDYAIHTLLELEMIVPCGRKDAVGKPILYATTDEFLKRFKLNSLEDLPDYETLMAAIARPEEDKDNYLYARTEYSEIQSESSDAVQAPPKENAETETDKAQSKEREEISGGYEIPDFLRGLDDADIVKIG